MDRLKNKVKPMFFKSFSDDITAFLERDPAAKSRFEVILCYPGLHALVFYRLANALWRRHWHVTARFLSQVGRALTGIEIHPGATIGERFVIDHGAGVVIGETSVIGDDVTIYHDVTLGGVAPSVDSAAQKNTKRHPTLADGVIIGSGAQVLGPITIGEGARVGSNAVVHQDVPAGMTAVGIPARVVMPKDKSKARVFVAYGEPIDGIPDPVRQTIEDLRRQVQLLTEEMKKMEGRLDVDKPRSGDHGSNEAPDPAEDRVAEAGRGE